jgi:hypothetical protein
MNSYFLVGIQGAYLGINALSCLGTTKKVSHHCVNPYLSDGRRKVVPVR